MDIDDKRLQLAKHMEEFRCWTYDSLATQIDRTRRDNECLRYLQGVFDDGTEYQIEFNVFWDDQRDGDLRVCGDLTCSPQRGLLGFLPIFVPDVTDSFIMRRDGTFVD